jgi:hypothetical protein
VVCPMAKGRENAAERLWTVLDYLRARQQSGLLSVERLHHGLLEEGEVYLEAGLPVYASTGQLSGQDALNVLLSWRQIRFAFFPDAPLPAALQSSFNAAQHLTPSLAGLPPSNPEGPVAAEKVNDDAAGYLGLSSAYGTTYRPGLEWMVPRRLSNDLSVLSLLNRRQRSIYLLVDGKRTVADLGRCTNKSVQEIERILMELQEQGLVTL